MTDYEQRCRETCPWCEKDRPLFKSGHVWQIGFDEEQGPVMQRELCTAPTLEQFAEEMAQGKRSAEVQLAAKEVLLLRAGEFIIGLGYTGELSEQAGLEWAKGCDQWRENFDSEHELQIKYQEIVYMVCHFLDVALGNSAKRGTCLLAEKDAIHLALVRLFHSQHQPEEPSAIR